MSGLYKKPTNKKYSDIVNFESEANAKNAASILENEFISTRTYSKRLLIKQVANYAANRAKGSMKKKNISPATRRRYAEISKIYRSLFERLKKIEITCK